MPGQGVTDWTDVIDQDADLARAVESLFGGGHGLVATLRLDGSPRISVVEVVFLAGQLWLLSTWGSRKTVDLRRDPRFALHATTPGVVPHWPGDAKIAGRAFEVSDPDAIGQVMAVRHGPFIRPPSVLRTEVDEVVLIQLGAPPDHLLVESWHERSWRNGWLGRGELR